MPWEQSSNFHGSPQQPPNGLDDILNTPLARLEIYGLPLRIINVLEDHVGLYIRNVLAKNREDLGQIRGIGVKGVDLLILVLQEFLSENGINLG